MSERKKRELYTPLKFTVVASALASTAFFAVRGFIDVLPGEIIPIGVSEISCGEDPVTVEFDPNTYDTEILSGQVRVRAYNPANESNPSGFFIDVGEETDSTDYTVGVTLINDEGITGLDKRFFNHGEFAGFKEIDLDFEANQGHWFIDVHPEKNTVTVAGTCLQDSENDTSIRI